MKRIKKRKRLLALALSFLLVISGLPATAYAEAYPTEGLCIHHTEHTEDCGYTEEKPCRHKHTEDCYTDELICGLIEEETDASDSNTGHTHEPECHKLDCPHEHGGHDGNGGKAGEEGGNPGGNSDRDCGYEAGIPCEYICQLCGKLTASPELNPSDKTGQLLLDGAMVKTVLSWTFVDDGNLNEGELPLITVSAENQADLNTVVSMLPTKIRAELDKTTDGETGDEDIPGQDEIGPVILEITGWSCPEYVQDGNGDWPVDGAYVFKAELPNGYRCDPLPEVDVLLGGGEFYSDPITGDGYSFNPDTGELTVSGPSVTADWTGTGKFGPEDVTKLVIENSVETIGRHAFSSCTALKDLTIPEGVKSIEDYAFYECTKLENLTIPKGVKSISEYAFSSCTGLKNVVILEGVERIEQYAFYECSELKEVTISDSVNFIENSAFGACRKLTSVTIKSKIAPSIDNSAFWDAPESLVIYVPYGATGYDSYTGDEGKFVEGSALVGLTISEGTLTPAFSPETDSYEVSVSNAVSEVTVTPTAHGTGTITVDGNTVTSGAVSGEIALETGKSKAIHIIVKTNETLSRTYTVTVTREAPAAVSIKEIRGLTPPVYGTVPVETVTATAQYTGTVTWSPALTAEGTFESDTEYTATVILAPKLGYTCQGVGADFFTVAGAVTVTNGENSNKITAVFPKTEENPAYILEVNKTTINFGSLTVGYAAAPDAKTVTVRNAGNQNVTFSLPTAAGYTVTAAGGGWNNSRITLIPGEEAAFTVRPETGLGVGTHNGTLTISGTGNAAAAVSLDFTVSEKPVHTVTVETSEGGTADADPARAAEGDTITLSVMADSGYQFKEWQVISGGITVADARFVMPAGNVKVKAVFEKISRPSSGGSSSGGGGSYTNTGTEILQGTWVQNGTGGWMFRRAGGTYARNLWGMADGLWYYFDGEGRMLTGWQLLGGQWYYLCTKEDLTAKAGMKEGAMASGWHVDPVYQKRFYLKEDGAMVTGWREIDGKWYYFNPVSDGTRGVMVTDRAVDGRYIDKNGVWNGDTEA